MENNKSNVIGTMRIYTKKAADAAKLFFAFENDDHTKCMKEAAESYRALEHPEKTMQDAMKETAELFPFI